MMNTISFKKVWTSHTVSYPVSLNWTLSQMISELSSRLSEEFNIPESELEFIPNNKSLDNQLIELSQPVSNDDLSKTLCYLYGEDLCIAFYIRQKNQSLPTNITISQCIICFEERMTNTPYRCNHRICNNCIIGCERAHLTQCPLCR